MSGEADAFVEWARRNAVPVGIPRTDENYDDLEFLGEVIGQARIVALGESAHYLHEWNRFRARLFKFLVERHGFNTFVLETGLVEGRNLYEYVLGGDVAWDTVVGSITNGWGVWAEVHELLHWMRERNAESPGGGPLRFYGMDGSGNWSHAHHTVDAVAAFLQKVDGALLEEVSRDLGRPALEVGLEDRANVDAAVWDKLIARSSLLISRLEQNRFAYIERDSREDYDWALRSARVMRDLFLVWAQTDPDLQKGFRSFWNTRDVAMADSVAWILDREGPDAKLVIGAHNTHLQQYPVRVQRATSMGSYLADRIGRSSILFIGAANALSVRGDAPDPECNQAVYERVGQPGYFLDLRKAPSAGPVRAWLDAERIDRSNLRYQPVAPGRAWNCLLYHRSVRIAELSLPPSLRWGRAKADRDRLDDYVGHYVMKSFLGARTDLSITRDGETLYADGMLDTSGELFPPARTEIVATDDGCFTWENWPAILEFIGEGHIDHVRITMPGMGVYEGERGDPPK